MGTIRPVVFKVTPPAPPVDPYNPLGLPANTIRCKFQSGYTPNMGNTQTLVDSTNNVWDIYKESNNWDSMFYDNYNLLEILGANTTNVTNMSATFTGCWALTNIVLFDTSNVTNMCWMFENCQGLTTIPLLNTSKVTNISYAFRSCEYVQSGALALYQQASTQTTPPTDHAQTFNMCGNRTQTGTAELSQIPSDWK